MTGQIFYTASKDTKEDHVEDESVTKIVTLDFNMFVILEEIV